MLVIGIDPGVSGAIAALKEGKVAGAYPMPVFQMTKTRRAVDPDGLARLVRQLAPDHAFVEAVHSMPRDGHVGAFSFGRSAGIIEGVLAALMIARTMVAPNVWKMSLRVPADKDAARKRATQLFPSSGGLWPLVKDDGKAEAALIAYWGTLRGIGGVAGGAVEW